MRRAALAWVVMGVLSGLVTLAVALSASAASKPVLTPGSSSGDQLCGRTCAVCPQPPVPGNYAETPRVTLDASTRSTLRRRCIPRSQGSFTFGATVNSNAPLTSMRVFVDGTEIRAASRVAVAGKATHVAARVVLERGRPARAVPLAPGSSHEIELIATNASGGVTDMKFPFRTCGAGASKAGGGSAQAAQAKPAAQPMISVDGLKNGDELTVQTVDVEAQSQDRDSKDPIKGFDDESKAVDPKTKKVIDIDKCAPGIELRVKLTGTALGDTCEGSVEFTMPNLPLGSLAPQGVSFAGKNAFLHGGLNNGMFTLEGVLSPTLAGAPGAILSPRPLTALDKKRLKNGVKVVVTTTTTKCTVQGPNGPMVVSYKPPMVVTTTVTLKSD